MTNEIPVLISDHARKRAEQRGGDVDFLARTASQLAAAGRIPKRGMAALVDPQGCTGIGRYAGVSYPRLVLVTVLPPGARIAPGTVRIGLEGEATQFGKLDSGWQETEYNDRQAPAPVSADQVLADTAAFFQQLREMAGKC